MSLSDRAAWVNAATPHLVADVTLRTTEEGGRRLPALPGWGCPCMVDPDARVGYDAWPILGDVPLMPGDQRRLGFVFLTEEGARTMRDAGRFHLWEGKLIGEASVVPGTAAGRKE